MDGSAIRTPIVFSISFLPSHLCDFKAVLLSRRFQTSRLAIQLTRLICKHHLKLHTKLRHESYLGNKFVALMSSLDYLTTLPLPIKNLLPTH